MRHYAVEDEVRIALGRHLRDWARAGLVSPDQAQALRGDLATGLRRTGVMLRLGLAAFTVIAGAAAVGLVVLVTGLRSEFAMAVACAMLGAAALAAATALVVRVGLYRHGVEEALAMGAVALFGVSAGLLAAAITDTASGAYGWSFGMAAVAIAAGEAYRRFGFQYAAVAAMYALALLPIGFGALDVELTRVFAAVVCTAGYVASARVWGRADDDVSRSDAEVVRAAAVVGGYLALNVVITGEPLGRREAAWFTWSTWAITWLLPVAAGRAAILARDPLLLRVAVAMGLASLVTNKSYLGWPRQPWDPMLLGVVLVGVAVGLRRWLSAGADAERNGFTARQLVDSDAATMQLAGLASVALQPAPERQMPGPDDPTFSGGRSGGAGAGSSF